ncbi:MAG: FAD-dependent oxidoreductase [bacterium]
MPQYDAILIGAGFTGLCTGALLACRGQKVLLLDKRPGVGGRAGCLEHRRHVLDDGAHMPSEAGHLERIFEKLGLDFPKLHRYPGGEVYQDEAWRPMKDVFPMAEAREVLHSFATMPREEVERLYDVSVRDWYGGRSEERGWELLWTYLAQIADVGNKTEDLSLGEMIHFFREHFQRGLKLNQIGGTLQGGLRALTEPLRNYIETHGGEIRLSTPVSDIVIEQGVARGVELEVGERLFPSHIRPTEVVKAPLVICTLPVWDLFKVISEDEFPIWYRDWIRRLEKKICHVWTIVCAVDEPLWDIRLFRWHPYLPRTGTYGIFFQHQSYGDKAGQTQVNLCIQGSYQDLPDLSELEWARTRRAVRHVLDNLMEDGRELLPGLAQATRWEVRTAAAYGLSESPGISGRHRPSMVPPGIQNLFMASDTVREARGVGMQAAASVALSLMERLFPSG